MLCQAKTSGETRLRNLFMISWRDGGISLRFGAARHIYLRPRPYPSNFLMPKFSTASHTKSHNFDVSSTMPNGVMSPRTDTLFRKWQQRYDISEQAFHALWGILAAVEHDAELERHNGISHQVFPQSQPLDLDGRPTDGWLLDGMIPGADAGYSSIGNGSNPQPNTDGNFISGGSNIELFDDDILVGGYNMEVAYMPEVQSFSDNLDFLPGDTSILAEQPPTRTPLPQISSWSERLPNGRQQTVDQHFDQAQISYVTPSATTLHKKRNSAQDAAESAIGHKRQKSTKQCIKCWISKRSVLLTPFFKIYRCLCPSSATMSVVNAKLAWPQKSLRKSAYERDWRIAPYSINVSSFL